MNDLSPRVRFYWREFKKPVIVLMLLLALLVVIFGFSDSLGKPPQMRVEESRADAIRNGTAPIPEFTDAVRMKVDASKGFSALVSYTDGGFEPREVTIRQGESVRFTNNSSSDLWIASSGTNVAVYPRTKDTCGSSDLDSCNAFSPQDFWEFTFDQAGTWEVLNNLDKSKSGIVRVE